VSSAGSTRRRSAGSPSLPQPTRGSSSAACLESTSSCVDHEPPLSLLRTPLCTSSATATRWSSSFSALLEKVDPRQRLVVTSFAVAARQTLVLVLEPPDLDRGVVIVGRDHRLVVDLRHDQTNRRRLDCQPLPRPLGQRTGLLVVADQQQPRGGQTELHSVKDRLEIVDIISDVTPWRRREGRVVRRGREGGR
jgi:hypothetical protein